MGKRSYTAFRLRLKGTAKRKIHRKPVKAPLWHKHKRNGSCIISLNHWLGVMQSPFLRLCGSRYTFVQTCLGDGVPTDKTAFTECFYVYIRNISYYKNALIILSFGLFLLNLQIIAIVMQMKRINRLKIVLAEQGKTGKWLAHALGKNESTVSRWCTNEVQPSVETLLTIAETLKIDIKELLCSTQICNQDDNTQI